MTAPAVLRAPDTVTVGQPITITPGAWSPGTTVTDVWQRCDSIGACQTIPGATGTTYVPTARRRRASSSSFRRPPSPSTGAIVVYTDATEPIAFADGSQPDNAPLLPPGTDPAVPASESQAAIDAGGVTVVDPVADAAAAAAAADASDDASRMPTTARRPTAASNDGGLTTSDDEAGAGACLAHNLPASAKRLKLRQHGPPRPRHRADELRQRRRHGPRQARRRAAACAGRSTAPS